jgi:hypothetical protein
LRNILSLLLVLLVMIAPVACRQGSPEEPAEHVRSTGQAHTATRTTVTASSISTVFGQPVTFQAIVESVTAAAPAGTVTFFDGPTPLRTGTLDPTGAVSFVISSLGVGAHAITAQYEGSDYAHASTSDVFTQTVGKASTATSLSASSNPSMVGTSVTLFATVSVTAPGAGPRTGAATFYDNGAVLGTGAVNAAGLATYSTAALTGGTHTIAVVYGGDLSFATSTSANMSQSVKQDEASVGLTSSVNPSEFGSSTTFTATLTSGSAPTGAITFKDGSATLGTVAVDGAGIATLPTAALTGGTHTIVAEYAGDAKNHAATGSLPQTVNVGPSTMALTSLTNPSVVGQSVTLKAAVTGTGATPAGMVSFVEGGLTLGRIALNGAGEATLSVPFGIGGHSISASYSGDANFDVSGSALVQLVHPADTMTVTISSAEPSIVDSWLVFSASVSAAAPGAGTPSGGITFKEGAAMLGIGFIDDFGVATFATGALAAGTHTISVSYGGDASFNASSTTITQTVNKDGVTTTLASSANPSTFGGSVTFTASVTTTGAAGIATGTVAFKEGAVVLGTGALDGAGVATYTTSALVGGSRTIMASYGGDSTHAGGSSAAVAQIVVPAASTTALASSVDSWVSGQPITLTATVTSTAAGTLTGNVAFLDGVTTVGTGMLDAAGVAQYTTSTLTVEHHALTAVYGGDANYAKSTSGAVSYVVNKGSSATVVTSSTNPSLASTSVTFAATVTATLPSAGTPSGTVTFKDGMTVLGTGTLDVGGVATCSTDTLGVGAHTITATYGGSAKYETSSSAPLTQAASYAAAATSLTSAPSPSTYGGAVKLTSAVTGSRGTPTGTVVFKELATEISTATLDASGIVTGSVATLKAGTHTLTAAYSGNMTYASGTATVPHVVEKATTTTTVRSAPNPSILGEAVTLTATVATAAADLAGSVEFFDGTSSLGTAVLTGATATTTTSLLQQGGHSISAVYKGDDNVAPSTSAGVTQVVNAKPGDVDAGAVSVDASVSNASPVTSVTSDTGCSCRIEEPSTSTSGVAACFALAAMSVVVARRRLRR